MRKRYSNHNAEVEIVAEKLTKANAQQLADWCGGYVVEETDAIDANIKYVAINLPTPDGMRRASEGDYIAHSDRGFDPWKPGIFETSFEET